MGLPPSPWLKLPKLICKHRNEEGGLGFAAYTNAAAGGDWIIQPALENACEIARLLPVHAPLSNPDPKPKPNPSATLTLPLTLTLTPTLTLTRRTHLSRPSASSPPHATASGRR